MTLGPAERLYPATPLPVQSSSGQYTMASRFTVELDGQLDALRYYHMGGAGCIGNADHGLSVWSDIGGKLAGVTDTPPDLHIGWREVALVPPLRVVAGDVLRVSYGVDNQTYGYTSELPPPDLAPSLTVDPTGGYYGAGVDVFPSNATNLYHAFADVVYRSGEPSIEVAPGTRPWRDVLATIAARIDADPRYAELGVTLASAWSANLATPAVIVTPVRRITVRPGVRWELALQVILPLQSDDDEPLHELVELCLIPMPGVIPGDTVYGQDDRAGASYLVATTTLTA